MKTCLLKICPGTLVLATGLLVAATAQEKKEDFVENFDGSKQEITEANPAVSAEDPKKISLGDLSKDKVKEDKVAESMENMVESQNAKGEELEALIESTLKTMRPALSANGLELNQAAVFPADI